MRRDFPPVPLEPIVAKFRGVAKQDDGSFCVWCPLCDCNAVHIFDTGKGAAKISCPNCKEADILQAKGLQPGDLVALAGGGAVKLAPLDQVDGEAWRERLSWSYRRDGSRRIKTNGANAAVILANDQDVAGCFGYDLFLEDIACLRAPPWNEGPMAHDFGRTMPGAPWRDDDYTRLRCWLESAYDLSVGRDALYGIALMVARQHQRHPVRDYLDGLAWDGTPRLRNWLRQYLGASDPSDYLHGIGPQWLISAVARVFQPGCKADHVLILEGRQGIGKSTALRLLAGEWNSDTPIHIGTKDAYQALRGVWIVELAELDSVIRAENSEAKAFFTSGVDRYRPPYARAVSEYPRQCVFAGSVNGDDYLRDETGARRYWPVACEAIDLVGLARDRDQLWAEAVSAYKRGDPWWPTADEQRIAGEQQASRQVEDAWLPLVVEFLQGRIETQWTTQQLLREALSIPNERIDRRAQMRLSRIMGQVDGWSAGRVDVASKRVRGYVKDGTT